MESQPQNPENIHPCLKYLVFAYKSVCAYLIKYGKKSDATTEPVSSGSAMFKRKTA